MAASHLIMDLNNFLSHCDIIAIFGWNDWHGSSRFFFKKMQLMTLLPNRCLSRRVKIHTTLDLHQRPLLE